MVVIFLFPPSPSLLLAGLVNRGMPVGDSIMQHTEYCCWLLHIFLELSAAEYFLYSTSFLGVKKIVLNIT